jgi:hypothetical protein
LGKEPGSVQRRATLCALHSPVDQAQRFWVMLKKLAKQVQIAQQGHEQVVEVMRNTTDDFHLLSLPEQLFRPLPLRYLFD